jgi:hypothetical protein
MSSVVNDELLGRLLRETRHTNAPLESLLRAQGVTPPELEQRSRLTGRPKRQKRSD